MGKARAEEMWEARALYRAGWKLTNIAAKIGIPPGTVRRWKHAQRWGEPDEKKPGASEAPIEDAISETLENSTLTGKQQQFVIHYAKSFNATRSYQKAYGCSYNSALRGVTHWPESLKSRKRSGA